MMDSLRRWFKQLKWVGATDELAASYTRAFHNVDGQRVLQHLLDSVYCTVYEGVDPQGAFAHNARRSVIQEILENIDRGENPDRYVVRAVYAEPPDPTERFNGMDGRDSS